MVNLLCDSASCRADFVKVYILPLREEGLSGCSPMLGRLPFEVHQGGMPRMPEPL